MGHILARAGVHFVASFFLVVVTYAALSHLWRRLDWFVSGRGQRVTFAVVVAVPCALIPSLREAFDVAAGQSLAKAVADYVSWFAGAGAASWLVYRIRGGGF